MIVRQFGRFGVVGVVNTLVSLVVYSVLLATGTPYLLATAVAFAAGAVNGYVLNRRWTFRAQDSRRARALYVAVQLGGLLTPAGLVGLLVRDVGMMRIAAYPLATAPVTLATFAANRSWTFSQEAHRKLSESSVTF